MYICILHISNRLQLNVMENNFNLAYIQIDNNITVQINPI